MLHNPGGGVVRHGGGIEDDFKLPRFPEIGNYAIAEYRENLRFKLPRAFSEARLPQNSLIHRFAKSIAEP